MMINWTSKSAFLKCKWQSGPVLQQGTNHACTQTHNFTQHSVRGREIPWHDTTLTSAARHTTTYKYYFNTIMAHS